MQTIGHGASSTVYEAQQKSTGRRVALKIVGASTAGGAAERLYSRERAVLAELAGHPNIVSIVDAGEWNGRFWLAMEHCPYGSVVRPGERLDVADAVAVLAGIGSALEAAHRAGLVHCDVKPANLLRNQYGNPALADFGIAKFVLATGQGSTATGYTLDHASPEVLDGERPTGASDVWSLGTALWEMLEGHPPFRRSGEVAQSAVIRRICFDPTPPVTRADVPAELRELIAEMTQKGPADRPALGEVVARAQSLQAVVGMPDPDSWAQTIVAPLPPDHLGAPEAHFSTSGGHPEATSARPSLEELTNYRPGARREWAPPVIAQPEAPARRIRAWPVVAASLLAVLLLGSGSVVTWRFANAESAPAPSAAAPTSSNTTSETSSETPPPSSEPAVPYDGGSTGGYGGGGYVGGGSTGGGSAPDTGATGNPSSAGTSEEGSGENSTSGGGNDGASSGNETGTTTGNDTDAPCDEDGGTAGGGSNSNRGGAGEGTNHCQPSESSSERTPTPKIGTMKLADASCRTAEDKSCASTTAGIVTFRINVTDTTGDRMTDNCKVTVTLRAGSSRGQASGACGATLTYRGASSGQYSVLVKVVANGETKTGDANLTVG
ncbi:serine/threonine-protein kinase [Actinomycetospora flava]|uniref:non-specific serine/threonine protein kinase n=1 Tax=Actinomycetospora flava TaxID=3129232 RepID=A0ABU8MBH4_9PSEU